MLVSTAANTAVINRPKVFIAALCDSVADWLSTRRHCHTAIFGTGRDAGIDHQQVRVK
jgi:hypothetical protein